mgnify:CR=1 FL=1
MQQKIIILDFGSQTTQLIGRRVRELDTFCEILPYNKFPKDDSDVIGVILSGSPYSVHDEEAFKVDLSQFVGKYPVLGICYGAQFIANSNGGKVEKTGTREYGRANLRTFDADNALFKGFEENSQVWMSHGDTITAIPADCHVIASTADVKYAAYASDTNPLWAVQFHPEVFHTSQGKLLLKNFVVDICGSKQQWSPASFVDSTVSELKEQLGNDRVILGLSGGVDSSVCATLLNRAIGKNLTCIFVDHGMLRKNEFQKVMEAYQGLGLNVIGVDASEKFFKDLEGVTDPEQKRKIIGRDFVEVFNAEAKKITDAKWLAQGTIYPDRIESLNITGKTIKSHHNVGGLPDDLQFELVEPLRQLFKDEVRACGVELGLPYDMVYRQPFPGPGLGVRCLGAITRDRLEAVRESDAILREEFKNAGLDKKVWQYFTVVPDFKSVGVRDNARSFEWPVIIRAVNTVDAMTATIEPVDWPILMKITDRILKEVKNVNRVCYDMSPKPNATIEWE